MWTPVVSERDIVCGELPPSCKENLAYHSDDDSLVSNSEGVCQIAFCQVLSIACSEC